MPAMNTSPLLLSLKPCYADFVFDGRKTAELRRRLPVSWQTGLMPCMGNRHVFIYASSPVRKLRGGFRVECVWSGTPEDVWRKVSTLAGVEKQDFDAYYAGYTFAYALKITDVWEYEYPADLSTLRTRFSDFVVPQSWRYMKPEECRSFRRMKRKV